MIKTPAWSEWSEISCIDLRNSYSGNMFGGKLRLSGSFKAKMMKDLQKTETERQQKADAQKMKYGPSSTA